MHKDLLAQWIRYARNRGIYQKDVAERSGIAGAHLSKLKTEYKNPNPATIEKLANAFEVSLEEYLLGPPESDLEKLDTRNYEKARVSEMVDDFTYIPHFDIRVSAGGGAESQLVELKTICAFRTEWVRNTIHSKPADLFLVDVTGDSMEPTLSDGDIVLVNKTMTQLNKEGMYVFRLYDSLLVKRLKLHIDGTLEISSDNKTYPVDMIKLHDQENIKVLGKVLWYGKTIY